MEMMTLTLLNIAGFSAGLALGYFVVYPLLEKLCSVLRKGK